MRLSNKQAQMLVEILRATLSIGNLSTYNTSSRKKLYDNIINQQDNEIVELGNLSGIKEEGVLK